MDILEWFTSHTSVRSFQEKQLSEQLKKQLIQAAQSGSSSNFVQAYSIIEVRNQEKLKEVEAIANFKGYGAEHGVFYLFVADLNRNYQIASHTNNNLEAFSSMESLLVSVVDTTIAAQNMTLFAESQDLGICYIGGIRNDLFRIAELFALPKLTIPLFGLIIGYPNIKNEVKPRLFQEEIVKIDEYQEMDPLTLQRYDDVMNSYYQERTNHAQQANWSEKVQEHFKINRRPEVIHFLKHQGFDFFEKNN
jgi:nitroreductase